MNNEKYTQKSLEALQDSHNIAIENSNSQIEQAHLLYALLKSENTGVTACSHTHPQDASDSVNADNKLQIRQGWQT